MATQATYVCKFPKNSDVVIKMFTDKAYFLTKYANLGAMNIDLLEHDTSGDEFSIKISREVPADITLPDFVKKFIPGNITAIQKDRWNRKTKKGRLEIQLKGLPASISCDMELKEDGNGCANHMNWTFKADVPLFGGKLEKLLKEDILGKADADTAEGIRLLVNYG